MKSIQNIPRAAFTLIELLVVITIIATLAGIAIPTVNIVMRKAKETQAKAAMAGLIIGIKAYQTEYNRFPDPSGGSTNADAAITLDGGGGNNDLMMILHPDQTASPPTTNPRRINFYDPTPAKNGANGLDSSTHALLDPWSTGTNQHYYRVAMDYNGDNVIDQSVDPTSGNTNIQATVIAWSTGQPTRPPAENSGTDQTAAKYFLCSWK